MTTTLGSPMSRSLPGRLVHKAAELIATPLVPRDFIDLVSPLSNPVELRGRITAIDPETSDTASIRIAVGSNWRPHRAGQYVRVGVEVDGVRLWRTYSITSPPTDRGAITLTVKAIPDGTVSQHLVRNAKPGALVHLDQAAGDFTVPAAPPARILLVTAGSGITPVMGMLRTHLDELDDVVLVHSARGRADVIFGPQLRAWARQGRLTLIEHHTGAQPRLTAARLAELVPDWAQRPTWACGPAGLLDDLQAHYTRAGVADRLCVERFRTEIAQVGTGGTVAFARTNVAAETDGATTLLDVGEQAGVLMPSGCRMGVCFGCVVPLTGGAVRDVRNGAITWGSRGAGVVVQTCISTAAGSCELDV